MKKVVVEKYNPEWKDWYQELKTQIWPLVFKDALKIEHVGSTSVEGLSAKPRIDIDIIAKDSSSVQACILSLALLGYKHLGDLGIIGREAFSYESHKYDHNLYVCLEGADSLKNHLTLRDHLRLNEEDRTRYSEIKESLALKFPENIDAYIDGKTEFILSILEKYDFDSLAIDSIKSANKI